LKLLSVVNYHSQVFFHHPINENGCCRTPETNSMRKMLFGLLATLSLQFASAQQNNFWTSRDAGVVQITANRAAQRASFPANYKLFDLNMTPFRQEMMSVAGTARTKASTIITLPNADGGLETFELVEASNFEPALQERFPDIRSFSGKGITDPSATVN
jgi:hypothetical protein